MVGLQCSKCGTSVDNLHRTVHGNLCGGCFHAIPGAKTSADVVAAECRARLAEGERDGLARLLESEKAMVEELLAQVSMLEIALLGAQAERTLMQKEVERCRSTNTAAPAAPAQN